MCTTKQVTSNESVDIEHNKWSLKYFTRGMFEQQSIKIDDCLVILIAFLWCFTKCPVVMRVFLVQLKFCNHISHNDATANDDVLQMLVSDIKRQLVNHLCGISHLHLWNMGQDDHYKQYNTSINILL